MEKNIQLKELLERVSMEHQTEFEEISDFIFKHPELGGEEFQSSAYLAEVLRKHGFQVSFPYENLPTAFIAEFGEAKSENLTVGFVAEYDALPGYKEFGGNAHACGHNWIGATMCGCGIALSKIQGELGCKIIVFGTPAEETFGAKYNMAEAGAFHDLDVAFQAHLDEYSIVEPITLAMNSIEFSFKGLATHAAQHPHKGINALDGVIAMFNGINALRQHLKQDVRIHGIITEGGVATNIVPDWAVCRFSMRSQSKSYLAYVRERIIKIAEAASMMSGAELSYSDYENPFDNMVIVPELVSLTKENLIRVGIDRFVSKEESSVQGSSDIGNVSFVCPTLYTQLELEGAEPFLVHDESALKYANGSAAYRKINQVINAFGGAVIDLCMEPKRMDLIKNQHKQLIGV